MILEESEVIERYESPMNLLNRLRTSISPNRRTSDIPSIPPSSDKLIEDLEDKLKYGGLKSKASAIMSVCLDELKNRITDVEKPKELAAIASEMSKVIAAQSNEKDKTDKPQIIIYSPSFNSEEHFDTIYVKE